MANLKILVAYHKKSPVVENEVFLPIHLGQGDDYDYLATQMIGDDTGDNISQKNSTYNEFTAVYWAWKNYDKIGNPDYIGLNHYRRFFIFEKRKYAFYDTNSADGIFEKLNYSPENVDKVLEGVDFVAPMPNVRSSVYNNYKFTHHADDFNLVLKIINEDFPFMTRIATDYAKGKTTFFYNAFIFKKQEFFDYCNFMFTVLEKYEKQTKHPTERMFITERLTGIYFAYLLEQGKKANYLPILFLRRKKKFKEVLAEVRQNFKEKKAGFLICLKPLILYFIPKRIYYIRKKRTAL